jgi:hypothetical protein
MAHRLALLLIAAALAFGADTSQWSGVRDLKKGDRIGVIQSDMKRMEGRFESANDTSITLLTDQPVTLTKDAVVRVYRRPRLNRGVRTLIGAGIGAVGGAVLDGTVGLRFRNESDGPAPGLITGLTAAAGAGLGAASGGGHQTVYQRR